MGRLMRPLSIAASTVALLFSGCGADESRSRTFVDSSGESIPITATYVAKQGDGLSTEEWPFVSPEVVYFCSEKDGLALAAYGADGRYGALNGSTSTLARRGFKVVDANGAERSIVSASTNAFQVNAGLLSANASNIAIGAWQGAMLGKLLAACDR